MNFIINFVAIVLLIITLILIMCKFRGERKNKNFNGRNMGQQRGQKKVFVSVVQSTPDLFNPIKSDIKKFGYQTVADASGLKAYQSVMKYYNGEAVRKNTEKKILLGIEKLNKGDFVTFDSVTKVKDIINLHANQAS